MKWHILFFVFLISALSANATSSSNLKLPLWNETWVDRLRKNLLFKYDKFSRPTQHYNTTTVYVYLNIMHVEVDSKKNILNVNTWVRMRWNDEKLKWNPKDYGGVDEFTVGIDEVWQPDLYLYNSALHGVEYYESRHGFVRKDGEVNWIAPTVFHSLCALNFVYWPFETNTCTLQIASWAHNGNQIDVRLQDEGYDLEYYSAGEWKVKNVSANRRTNKYLCCPDEIYVALDYEIKLTRSSELYYHIVFVVSIPIVFLVLITFWLKPQSETKLLLNICAVIIDMLFLLYFGFRVPARIDDNLPLIVRFFSGCLCQMTVSIIISAFVIHISTTSYDISVPRLVWKLLYGKMGKYLGLHGIIREIEAQKLSELQESQSPGLANSDLSINVLDNGDRQCIISQSKHVRRLEWILLATAVDRLSFILFCFIFAFIAIAYVRISSEAFSKTLNLVNIRPSSSENSTSMDYV